MGLLAALREQRRRQAMADRYVESLLRAPAADVVAWLAEQGDGDAARATAELSVAQRAIGLIVAERDALDDQTAADVAHTLNALDAREARQRSAAPTAWRARWREYADALAARATSDPPLRRVARVLLRQVGVTTPDPDQLAGALEIVTAFRHRANTSLQAAYGAASLPEDRAPSALVRERSGHG